MRRFIVYFLTSQFTQNLGYIRTLLHEFTSDELRSARQGSSPRWRHGILIYLTLASQDLATPGKSVRRLHAREAFTPSLESTHGPRVTTRARSKRGSDAGAIGARTRAARYDFDCELECPANYTVTHPVARVSFAPDRQILRDGFNVNVILTRVSV